MLTTLIISVLPVLTADQTEQRQSQRPCLLLRLTLPVLLQIDVLQQALETGLPSRDGGPDLRLSGVTQAARSVQRNHPGTGYDTFTVRPQAQTIGGNALVLPSVHVMLQETAADLYLAQLHLDYDGLSLSAKKRDRQAKHDTVLRSHTVSVKDLQQALSRLMELPLSHNTDAQASAATATDRPAHHAEPPEPAP